MKKIELSGVLNVPDTETSDTVLDKFITWVEANGWYFGGAVEDIKNDNQ